MQLRITNSFCITGRVLPQSDRAEPVSIYLNYLILSNPYVTSLALTTSRRPYLEHMSNIEVPTNTFTTARCTTVVMSKGLPCTLSQGLPCTRPYIMPRQLTASHSSELSLPVLLMLLRLINQQNQLPDTHLSLPRSPSLTLSMQRPSTIHRKTDTR